MGLKNYARKGLVPFRLGSQKMWAKTSSNHTLEKNVKGSLELRIWKYIYSLTWRHITLPKSAVALPLHLQKPLLISF